MSNMLPSAKTPPYEERTLGELDEQGVLNKEICIHILLEHFKMLQACYRHVTL